MRLALALCLLAACGRIGFDASTDGDAAAVIGHDEDGDRIADVDDLCPFTADPLQQDGDGDTVGDACDPLPEQPTERLAWFSTMTLTDAVLPEMLGSNAWERRTDAWRSTGLPFGELALYAPFTNGYIEVGFDVIEHRANVRGIAIAMGGGAGEPYYYAELYTSNGDASSIRISHFDGAAYGVVDGTDVTANEFTGHLRLRVSTRFPTDSTLLGATLGTGTEYVIRSITPSGSMAPMRVTVQQSIVEVSYIGVVITSP